MTTTGIFHYVPHRLVEPSNGDGCDGIRTVLEQPMVTWRIGPNDGRIRGYVAHG